MAERECVVPDDRAHSMRTFGEDLGIVQEIPEMVPFTANKWMACAGVVLFNHNPLTNLLNRCEGLGS